MLDHSGNIVRLREDFEDIYHNGLAALDMGEKLDKVVRKDEEQKEDRGCPSCGYKPFFKRCMACGHENKSLSDVAHQSGVMQEIKIGNKKAADSPMHLWQQITAYVVDRGNPDTRQGRAAHLFKDIVGTFPPQEYRVASTQPAPISQAVMNKIKSKMIAYHKAREAVAP